MAEKKGETWDECQEQVQELLEAYLEPSRTSTMELFYKNS